jgi:hypothetical protein
LKKRWILLLCLAGVLTAGVFADHPNNKVGIGLFFGGGWGSVGGGVFNPGLALKIPGVPIHWGLNAAFGRHIAGLSVSGDYYFVDRDLVKDGSIDLDWFLGFGGFTHIYFGSDFTAALGLRLPIGLSWHITRAFELFADLAPGIGVSFTSTPFYGVLGAELGFKVWI